MNVLQNYCISAYHKIFYKVIFILFCSVCMHVCVYVWVL